MESVTLLYKSGAKVHVRVEKLTVNRQGSEIVGVEWVSMTPSPLHIGVAELAAVFQGKV